MQAGRPRGSVRGYLAGLDPAIANKDLSPPRQRVLAPGLLPAVLAHVALLVALAANLDWKRGVDAVGLPSLAGATSADAPNDTARMGAPPMPSAAATVPTASATPARPVDRTAARTEVAALTPSPSRAAPRAAQEARQQPSFDCTRAHSVNERLICRDAELARLDRELGRIHARAKRAAADPAGFKRENDEEWRMREAVCRDKACLLQWYAHRREQLEARLARR